MKIEKFIQSRGKTLMPLPVEKVKKSQLTAAKRIEILDSLLGNLGYFEIEK